MNELRTLLINAVQREINDENVAIFFSGGTDSLTCLFCCLELNIKPKLNFSTDRYFFFLWKRNLFLK